MVEQSDSKEVQQDPENGDTNGLAKQSSTVNDQDEALKAEL